jgi:hypothetical protein
LGLKQGRLGWWCINGSLVERQTGLVAEVSSAVAAAGPTVRSQKPRQGMSSAPPCSRLAVYLSQPIECIALHMQWVSAGWGLWSGGVGRAAGLI